MALTGELFVLQSGAFRAEVSEVGAGLAGLWLDGRPLTTPWASNVLPLMSSGAVLLPWPNRLRGGKYRFGGVDCQLPLTEPAHGNAIHGLVRWVRWKVSRPSEDAVTLTHRLVAQTGFPFELSFEIRYALSPETGLTVWVSAANDGGVPAPFGAGFHPYLDLDGHDVDSVGLEVPARSVYEVDGIGIPVSRCAVEGTEFDLRARARLGALRLDHGFTDLTASRAVVRFGAHRTQLWWGPEFTKLQVFTPPIARFGRPAIAIEPMTCAADAFNSGDGLHRLEAGALWQGSWGISAA